MPNMATGETRHLSLTGERESSRRHVEAVKMIREDLRRLDS